MIGVFDSGLGGLSVLAAIARCLPGANLIYFADSAHLPYGDKPEEFIRQRVLTVGRHLIDRGCTTLVVACNTATAAAVMALRERWPEHAVIGIEPGVKPAATSSHTKHIAVLATVATANSARLRRLIEQHAQGVRVDIVPCPGWATRIEALQLADNAFAAEVAMTVRPLLSAGVDRLVLGCTHYAFLRPLLEPLLAEVSQEVRLVEVADAVAREVVRRTGPAAQGQGKLWLQASDQACRLQQALTPLGLTDLLPRLAGPAVPIDLPL